MGHAPNLRLSGFFNVKLALLGGGSALFRKVTLFSLPKVFSSFEGDEDDD